MYHTLTEDERTLLRAEGEADPWHLALRLIRERDEARYIARKFRRVAGHLALMHRRENRVMEGGEGEIERLLKLAREWIAEPVEGDAEER